MDPTLRARFNADFSAEKYDALLNCVQHSERWPADFRICETPLFLTREFRDEIVAAAKEIVTQTRTPEFARHATTAIPPRLEAPGEPPHPNFIVVDFGICEVNGRFTPRLIELQAFPSLYGFQLLLLGCLRRAFPAIPGDWTSAFSGLRDESYLALLRQVIIGNASQPEVLMAAKPAAARCLFIAVPNAFEAGTIVERARAANPKLSIIARAHSDAEREHLVNLGATYTIIGERELALEMLRRANAPGEGPSPTAPTSEMRTE